MNGGALQAYVVGGAVRDELLGLPVVDRDWVVVGATPEQMAALGYTPVGRDFPVFLHPQTHEEYALARTERKSGRGYKGFTVYSAPDVTLDDDLARRDLTINAMARGEDGALIDPFGGERDLKAGLLRHVGASFGEDPVRILRVARFAARFRFRVVDATMTLMQQMVERGEADHLVAERVWQEFSRGLCEAHPDEMFLVLERCAALARLAPELNVLFSGAARGELFETLARAVRDGAPLTLRFAALAWFAGVHAEDAATGLRAFDSLGERLRVPVEVGELASLVCRCREALRATAVADAPALLALLKRADAFRRKARFEALLAAAALAEPASVAGAERARAALAAASGVDAGAIARAASSGAQIAAGIDAARLCAIRAGLNRSGAGV